MTNQQNMAHDTLQREETVAERAEEGIKHALLLSLGAPPYRGHKKMWRQTQRRRITTLRRSVHLDLFTATSDKLSQGGASITSLRLCFYTRGHMMGGKPHKRPAG